MEGKHRLQAKILRRLSIMEFGICKGPSTLLCGCQEMTIAAK